MREKENDLITQQLNPLKRAEKIHSIHKQY
jgi:hypothetical protein